MHIEDIPYTRTTSEVALLGAASSWGREWWWQDYHVYTLNPGMWCGWGGTWPSVTGRKDRAHLGCRDGHCCTDNIHCTFLMCCGLLHFTNAALARTSNRRHIWGKLTLLQDVDTAQHLPSQPTAHVIMPVHAGCVLFISCASIQCIHYLCWRRGKAVPSSREAVSTYIAHSCSWRCEYLYPIPSQCSIKQLSLTHTVFWPHHSFPVLRVGLQRR